MKNVQTFFTEKAILVGVHLHDQENFQYSMEELANLAVAGDMKVVGSITQKMNQINPSHFVGSGKMEEIKGLLQLHQASLVIFNDELSPTQIRNLESDLACKVIDRTMLILDIFAKRAKTREAQLQVEVARLQYMLPRLINTGESLGRQSGGVGTKNRGAGETSLELNRRKIESKIVKLNKELELLVARRHTQRKRRKKNEIPVVSLVGYTNAGKSTIMNGMVEMYGQHPSKQVFEKDMLFATLETSVRHIHLPDKKSFLMTDTVGFVSKLPHHLVKAFRSTLEEVADADLLIHVVDYANAEHNQQISVTNEILKELNMNHVPVVYAYNKTDLTDRPIPSVDENSVYLSAKQQIGLDELSQIIREHLFADYIQCDMLIPFDSGSQLSYLNEHGHVLSTSYEPEGTKISIECSKAVYERCKEFLIS
ncbi:GTPase HflX [Brevibacillus daliensis]|uniref:GTPase HflX n=1 Tax=Brevibacillus daliensis TaxID=2892995 RepID=UPI001E3E2738|nr:GTPase HflX [Brevibacillus daliensis]